MPKKEANQTLYSFKAIASIFVIFLHIGGLRRIDIHLANFARFAVPLFFVIAGYYSFYSDKKEMKNKIKKRLNKIGKLTLLSFVLYLLINIVVCKYYGSMNCFINDILNYKNILKFLFYNWTTPIVGVGHLWYLFALLYVYIIMLFINKYNLYKYGYVYSIIAITVMYLFEIYNSINNLNIPQIYYRNAWIMGFSFFMLGHLIKKQEAKFKIFKNKLLLLSLLLSIPIVYYIEYKVMHIMNNDNCIFMSNIILVLLMIITAINYKNINFLSNIGKNDSSNIYIIHYVIVIFSGIYLHNDLNLTGIEMALAIFIESLILSVTYRHIKKIVLDKCFHKDNYNCARLRQRT